MTTIRDAVADLFNNQQLPAEEAIDRHYGPTFRQCTNGEWDERPGFVARIVALRQIIQRARVTVLDELADDNRYAERHVIDLVRRDAGRILQEVFVFAERDSEGRFVRIEEATRKLEEDEAERLLAKTR